MIKNDGKLGLHRLWLTTFDPNVLGGLRGKINHFGDSSSTILTPKKPIGRPVAAGAEVPTLESPDPAPACDPPSFATSDPHQNLTSDPLPPFSFDFGSSLEVTFSPVGLTGTTPMTFQWILNGVISSTDQEFTFFLTSSNVIGSTPDSPTGFTYLTFIATNDCGSVQASIIISTTINYPPEE